MAHDTSGHKGWWPMKFFEGKNPDGTKKGTEGFRNVVNGQEIKPDDGWSTRELPYATGDNANCRHVSNRYREGWERIWGMQ